MSRFIAFSTLTVLVNLDDVLLSTLDGEVNGFVVVGLVVVVDGLTLSFVDFGAL